MAALPDVNVTYQINGGAAKSEQCQPTGVCYLERETSGVFSIIASKPGYVPSTATVTVTRDECHVITEDVTLTLLPEPS